MFRGFFTAGIGLDITSEWVSEQKGIVGLIIGASYSCVPTTISIILAGRYCDIANPHEARQHQLPPPLSRFRRAAESRGRFWRLGSFPTCGGFILRRFEQWVLDSRWLLAILGYRYP